MNMYNYIIINISYILYVYVWPVHMCLVQY